MSNPVVPVRHTNFKGLCCVDIKSINIAFKATYYLYIHPNEKLNPHYKSFKNCHRIVCLIFFVFILSSFFCPSLGHTSSYAKMFIGCILALVFMIGFIGLIVVSQKSNVYIASKKYSHQAGQGWNLKLVK